MESIKKYNIYGVNRKYESDYGRNIDHNTIPPEQALKDLREDAKRHFFEQRQHLNKRLDIIEKHLKALEIIKKKRVEVFSLIACIELNEFTALETYNIKENCHNYKLTKEEFELLKEVLL